MGTTDESKDGAKAGSTEAAAPQKPVTTKAPARPDYQKPAWAGVPALQGEVAIELIVKGEVRKRIPLDVQAYNAFLFGRASNCDVVLEGIEPRASRFHCVLQCKAGCSELYAYDLKSGHGTVVNGRRIAPCTFEPVRVGEQLRFCADRPGSADCVAVLCGPEEAMADEGEVDAAGLREAAEKEREQREKAAKADLDRRILAKKQRLRKDAQRDALIARAQQHIKAQKDLEEKEREKLHEVTWGMAEDAVDPSDGQLDEQAEKLLDPSGRLDFEKVRALKLTDKQEQMVTKAEQKQKRVMNLQREKQRLEEKSAALEQRVAAADRDIDDVPESIRGAASNSLEALQKIDAKIEKAEDDLSEQTDNLFLSLGLKTGKASKKLRKQHEALYDTRYEDEDDDFFDRTASKKEAQGGGKAGSTDDVAPELVGLPVIDRVENRKSLELKSGLLKAEQARVTAQLAVEKAKEGKGAGTPNAGGEDSLDSFMSGAVYAEIRSERKEKLQRRLAAVDARLAEAEAMLRKAKQSAAEDPDEIRPKIPKPKEATKNEKKPLQEDGPSGEGSGSGGATEKASAETTAAANNTKRAKRGPERPPQATPAIEEEKAPPDAAAATPGASSNSQSEPATTAPVAAAATAAVSRAPRGPARPPVARAHIDPDKAGLQIMQAPVRAPAEKRGAEEMRGSAGTGDSGDATAAMPPPAPKERKVYGAARPPPRLGSDARDAGSEASGETDQVQG